MAPELMLAAFFNFLSSMISRLGAMGDKIAIEFGSGPQEVFTHIYRIFLDGIRAEPSHQQGGRIIEKVPDVYTLAEAK